MDECKITAMAKPICDIFTRSQRVALVTLRHHNQFYKILQVISKFNELSFDKKLHHILRKRQQKPYMREKENQRRWGGGLLQPKFNLEFQTVEHCRNPASKISHLLFLDEDEEWKLRDLGYTWLQKGKAPVHSISSTSVYKAIIDILNTMLFRKIQNATRYLLYLPNTHTHAISMFWIFQYERIFWNCFT